MRCLFRYLVPLALALIQLGCRTDPRTHRLTGGPAPAPAATQAAPPAALPVIEPASYQAQATPPPASEPAAPEELSLPPSIAVPEPIPAPDALDAPTLTTLAQSVRLHFPLIRQAVASRTIASGEVLAAQGAFDHKLEGYSVSQPLDFYENYRNSIALKRDTFGGGEVFAGYRIGRGDFEPWYLERQTNEGGEFNAGFVVPLSRDRAIDENRAELWRAQLERGRVEPEIRAMIIGATRDASAAYWQWVATAASYRIAQDVLQLGLDRTNYLERQVEEGEKADIELADNQRIILSRSAKATDARRKLQQAAAKLSLYLRDDLGRPIVLPLDQAVVQFPPALPPTAWGEAADVTFAQANRPELAELQLAQRQLAVLLDQATNNTLPQLDGGLLVSQDVGAPTSPKRDKSELKLEAALTLSVPLERRKALGKARQLQGKIAQIRAKTQFASDKVTLEAQVAHAALTAAAQRVDQTTEGLALAERMQRAEARLYELGQSTLFNLNLREQQTAEAAIERVAALYDYHVALADYAAALGLESATELKATEPADDEPLPLP